MKNLCPTQTMSFIPSHTSLKNINQMIRCKLAASFDYLSTIVNEVIEKEFSEKLSQSAETIRNNQRIDGYIFTLYQELLLSINNNMVDEVKRLIDKIYDYQPPKMLNIVNYHRANLGSDKYCLYEKYINQDDTYQLNFINCRESDFHEAKEKIKMGLYILRDIDNILYRNIITMVSEVVIIDIKSGPIFHSGTTFYTFGTIVIRFKKQHDVLSYLDFIIHEASHLYVYTLNVEDELVLNQPGQRFASPFRQDMRPMMGIYHATFVAARLAYFFKKMETLQVELINTEAVAHKKLLYLEKFLYGMKIMNEKGILTPLAKQILAEANYLLQ